MVSKARRVDALVRFNGDSIARIKGGKRGKRSDWQVVGWRVSPVHTRIVSHGHTDSPPTRYSIGDTDTKPWNFAERSRSRTDLYTESSRLFVMEFFAC